MIHPWKGEIMFPPVSSHVAAGDGRGDNIGATGEPCFQANLFGGDVWVS